LPGGGGVVAEQPDEGIVPLGIRVLLGGVVAGMQADEVVELVTAWAWGLQQVDVDQPLQHGQGGGLGLVQEPGGGGDVEVGSVGQAEQPEPGCSILVNVVRASLEGLQGDVEGGPHGQPFGGELIESVAGVSQSAGKLADRPAGPGGQPGAGDPEGQRQAAAQPHHLGGGLRLGGDPGGADDAAQQLQRLLLGKQVQMELAGAFEGAEHLAAGDEHCAARAARKKRTDLGGVVGVVEQDQQPSLGGQRPPPHSRLLDLGGDGGRILAEGPQQQPKGIHRGERWLSRGGAVDVDIQLSVREPVGELVGGLDRQRRLADAAHAVDGADQH
jgi:hypothetical protein